MKFITTEKTSARLREVGFPKPPYPRFYNYELDDLLEALPLPKGNGTMFMIYLNRRALNPTADDKYCVRAAGKTFSGHNPAETLGLAIIYALKRGVIQF